MTTRTIAVTIELADEDDNASDTAWGFVADALDHWIENYRESPDVQSFTLSLVQEY